MVGHILFRPAVISPQLPEGVESSGMGMAPMPVLAAFQCRGIGSALGREGLRRLRASGVPFVIGLGHPELYPRFGFKRASRHGIGSSWEGVPVEAFMILVLNPSGWRLSPGSPVIARSSTQPRSQRSGCWGRFEAPRARAATSFLRRVYIDKI